MNEQLMNDFTTGMTTTAQIRNNQPQKKDKQTTNEWTMNKRWMNNDKWKND